MNPESYPTPESAVAPLPSAHKLYSLNSVWGAGFVGGPLMSTYVLATNFKALGDPKRARFTWIIGTLFTALLFSALMWLPRIEERIPKYLIPALYCGASYAIMYSLQRVGIEKHMEAGGKLFSGWRVFGIGLLFLITTIVPLVAIGYYSDPFHELETAQFGKQHEIYYYPEQMTAAEVNTLGGTLRQTWLFDESYESGVLATKRNNVIEVNIVLMEGVWDDPEARNEFSVLRDYVQQFFPSEEIVFNLCADYDDVRASLRNSESSSTP